MTSTGDTTDHAMTRSEERLSVSTRRHVTGRARLQKFITTEMVTIEVPVRREEVRLVNEPAGDADRGGDAGEPYDGPPVDSARGQHEFVLHEERPVVTMQVVPVERVRMVVEQVTTTETVSGEVRAEKIDLEGDTGTTTR